jgi:hypothetical protein
MSESHFIAIDQAEMTKLEAIIERFHDQSIDRNPLERLLITAITPALISLKATCAVDETVLPPMFDPTESAEGRGEEFVSNLPIEYTTQGRMRMLNDHISLDGALQETTEVDESGDIVSQTLILKPNLQSIDASTFIQSMDQPLGVNLVSEAPIEPVSPATPAVPLPPGPIPPNLVNVPMILDPATGELIPFV